MVAHLSSKRELRVRFPRKKSDPVKGILNVQLKRQNQQANGYSTTNVGVKPAPNGSTSGI